MQFEKILDSKFNTPKFTSSIQGKFRQHTSILLIIFASAVLAPSIPLWPGLPEIRPDFLFEATALFYFLGKTIWQMESLNVKLPLRWAFSSWSIAIGISSWYGLSILSNDIVARDYWEVFKVLLYYIIFCFTANLRICRTDYFKIYFWFILMFSLSSCFATAQFFDLGGINQKVSSYYVTTQIRGLEVENKRVTGTTPNPNEFGALMVIGASLGLAGSINFSTFFPRIICIVCLLIATLGVLLSVSRTAFICLFLSTGVILYLSLFGRSCARASVVKILLLLVILTLLSFPSIPATTLDRLSTLENFSETAGWQARQAMWNENLTYIISSPFFGWGPGKSNMPTIVDNEWILLTRRYGLFGVILFITPFYLIYFRIKEIQRSRQNVLPIYSLALAIRSLLIVFPIFMVTAPIYHSLQLMSVLLLLIGFVFCADYHLRENQGILS